MQALGDPRSFSTILRSVSNWCRGEAAVPGEVWVVITLLRRGYQATQSGQGSATKTDQYSPAAS